MATENIVLLACAAVLCTLHVAGGPVSGLFRKPAPLRRAPSATDDRPRAEPAAMSKSETEGISGAS